MANGTHARGDARSDLYSDITARIIADLENGVVPWVQPWAASAAPLEMPRNAATGRPYSGINVLLLWAAVIDGAFSAQRWLTFRQALALGGHVRKGERGTLVVFADQFTPEREKRRAEAQGGEPARVPFLKRFTVFNIDQCEGLPARVVPSPAPPPDGSLILPRARALIAGTQARFRIGGSYAFYSPLDDLVVVPPPQAFHDAIDWHRTAFHELGHWTGHGSRLARDQSGIFGSASYAREELIAEMAGAFVCASLDIVPTVRHADYLGSWLEVLREDSRAIVRAASAASRAAEYLLAFEPGPERDPPAVGSPEEEAGGGFATG
jgi:antirestriction protein ArdC